MRRFEALPLPEHYDPQQVGTLWKVPYERRAADARAWAARHQLHPAAEDKFKLGILLIDVQNTFCLPDFELFVGGRSGLGAVEDNQRLCAWLYHNLGSITRIFATFDTHQALQIFHAAFLVDDHGKHPAPYTLVSAEDIASGRWRFNPALAHSLGQPAQAIQQHLAYYTQQLAAAGKYALTVWPYHAMLGGAGHALAPAVEEALFFHNLARYSQPEFILKGGQPLTEAYSAIGPEVLTDPAGQPIASKSPRILHALHQLDALVIAGQAKSHCVAWTIADLLAGIQAGDPAEAAALVNRIYLLDDCSSPVVVPGAIDYTDDAEAAYAGFAAAGMHRVLSTTPLDEWPGLAPA